MSLLRYKYYDTPDGQDIDKKLFVTCKYAGALGIVVSSIDVVFVSHTKGYLPTIGRVAHFTGPFLGMAAAFTLTSNLAQNMRQKDDKLNYILGALAAGAVAGLWRKSGMQGFVASVGFCAAAYVKKDSIQNGYALFPPIKIRQMASMRGVHHDFSLSKERPKGWTSEPEK